MLQRIQHWLIARRLAAAVSVAPSLCRRCSLSQRDPHRPCYAVGCDCRCSR